MDTALPLQSYQVQVEGKKFGIRALAYIIDLVIIYIGIYAISILVGLTVGIFLAITGREYEVLEESNQCLNLIIGIIQGTMHFTFFEWLYGATPGKLILGMRVVKETGEPCDFKAAFIRSLLRYIDGLFFGIPAYASMKPPLYQRIGDKDAKTLVVGSKDAIIRQRREWWWLLIAAALTITFTAIIALVEIASLIR